MKRIVLCADDFGQAPAISQGILELVAAGRLSAVSTMVTKVNAEKNVTLLLAYRDQVDIGLHFNLTEGSPLSSEFQAKYGQKLPDLPLLMAQSLLRMIDQSVIEAELRAQIDRFEAWYGFLPDFIDGHQHIHQFPVIRQALLSVYQHRLQNKPYVRCVNPAVKWTHILGNIKQAVIVMMGGRRLKDLLDRQGIPRNSSFSGIYDFRQADHYSSIFPHFLQQVSNQGLIMVHPGHAASPKEDTIASARTQEYDYLLSSQFERDCHKSGVVICRYKQCESSVNIK